VWAVAARVQEPDAELKELVAGLHTQKTDLFMQMVETGAMPLRPGVQRLVGAHSSDRPPI
jgi:hypothetical protein